MFQEVIPHSELTVSEIIGEGGFGRVYRAQHERFGTVVYKELNAEKLGERYLKYLTIFELTNLRFKVAKGSTLCVTMLFTNVGKYQDDVAIIECV